MNNQKIWKMAYDEAVTDLMMELCICESQAKDRLNNLLVENPQYLIPLYRQLYNVRYQFDFGGNND